MKTPSLKPKRIASKIKKREMPRFSQKIYRKGNEAEQGKAQIIWTLLVAAAVAAVIFQQATHGPSPHQKASQDPQQPETQKYLIHTFNSHSQP